jgi:hypothetical protein
MLNLEIVCDTLNRIFGVVTKGRDQSLSCIVIGGKVGASPSSLYTSKSDQGLQWMKK